jgi:DNA-binding LacI/PurR family transcriptional regulator
MTKNNQVNTNKELANLAGVGHDTISKVKEINKDMPPEVKEDMEKKINSGDISINQAHKAVRSVKN